MDYKYITASGELIVHLTLKQCYTSIIIMLGGGAQEPECSDYIIRITAISSLKSYVECYNYITSSVVPQANQGGILLLTD